MNTSVLDRIKKLLRLGSDKRGNPHEAERAMALAFELAERHRVDLESIDLDEETAKIVSEYIHVGLRLDKLRIGVIALIQQFFHVTVCICSPKLLLIGKAEDIAIATYVHDFLLRAGRDCLKTYGQHEKVARRRMTSAKRAGFLYGFVSGVTSRLQSASETLNLGDAHAAIVLAEKAAREAKLDELVPSHETRKQRQTRTDDTAIMRGWDAGRATTINTPLSGSSQQPLALQ